MNHVEGGREGDAANGTLPVLASDRARFIQAAARLGSSVTEREPLARHTTFRIGGPADLYAAATTIDQLAALTELAAKHGIPITVLGGGSNVLVSDAGVRGLVIANQTRHYAWRLPSDAAVDEQQPTTQPQLVADSGVLLAGLARTAIKAGYSGLEWAVSVPGTVGGAVIGNAGAYGSDIAGNLAVSDRSPIPAQGRQTLTGAAIGVRLPQQPAQAAVGAGDSAAGGAAGERSTCNPATLLRWQPWRRVIWPAGGPASRWNRAPAASSATRPATTRAGWWKRQG